MQSVKKLFHRRRNERDSQSFGEDADQSNGQFMSGSLGQQRSNAYDPRSGSLDQQQSNAYDPRSGSLDQQRSNAYDPRFDHINQQRSNAYDPRSGSLDQQRTYAYDSGPSQQRGNSTRSTDVPDYRAQQSNSRSLSVPSSHARNPGSPSSVADPAVMNQRFAALNLGGDKSGLNTQSQRRYDDNATSGSGYSANIRDVRNEKMPAPTTAPGPNSVQRSGPSAMTSKSAQRTGGSSSQVVPSRKQPAGGYRVQNSSQFAASGSGPLSAEEVISRAQTNSAHTTVTERIAPAVVHEQVRQHVHEIRQEVVTREVHNHDVYHRILPIVDVEVLPTRHFLPVEGGRLVEISGDQVPARGRNWVVAETASKIATGEKISSKPNRFSAREFPGTEGDDKKYTAPEGHAVTEQTWVHPPRPERGARKTGQTWPLHFDDGEKKLAPSPEASSNQRGTRV